MIVDCAVYADGERVPDELTLEEAYRRSREPDTFVWIGLFEPTEDEFDSVRSEFDLHELAVEDAIHAHQRPKLERYGETLFVVLKTARYDDEREAIDVGEILLFVGSQFIVAVRHGPASPLAGVRRELESDPETLRFGQAAVLHAIVDRVVDEYLPVVVGLENDVEEVESEVFSTARRNPAERIYFLKREVLEFHRATAPLLLPIERLTTHELLEGGSAFHEYFRDVHDHLLRVNERVESLRDLLTSILEANLSQVGIQQSEDMRKISAWVAIAAGPTALGGIYGMNFSHIPGSGFRFGFVVMLGLMFLISVTLFRFFRARGWL